MSTFAANITTMRDDISQSVSQRGYGAYDEENRRIRETADELQRLCSLHEEKLRDSQDYGSRFEIEQRVAEQYAKSVGKWIPMDNIFELGIPGPSGNDIGSNAISISSCATFYLMRLKTIHLESDSCDL